MKAALAWSLLGAAIVAAVLGAVELALFLAIATIAAAIADVELRSDRTAELEAASARAREARSRR